MDTYIRISRGTHRTSMAGNILHVVLIIYVFIGTVRCHPPVAAATTPKGAPPAADAGKPAADVGKPTTAPVAAVEPAATSAAAAGAVKPPGTAAMDPATPGATPGDAAAGTGGPPAGGAAGGGATGTPIVVGSAPLPAAAPPTLDVAAAEAVAAGEGVAAAEGWAAGEGGAGGEAPEGPIVCPEPGYMEEPGRIIFEGLAGECILVVHWNKLPTRRGRMGRRKGASRNSTTNARTLYDMIGGQEGVPCPRWKITKKWRRLNIETVPGRCVISVSKPYRRRRPPVGEEGGPQASVMYSKIGLPVQ